MNHGSEVVGVNGGCRRCCKEHPPSSASANQQVTNQHTNPPMLLLHGHRATTTLLASVSDILRGMAMLPTPGLPVRRMVQSILLWLGLEVSQANS